VLKYREDQTAVLTGGLLDGVREPAARTGDTRPAVPGPAGRHG